MKNTGIIAKKSMLPAVKLLLGIYIDTIILFSVNKIIPLLQDKYQMIFQQSGLHHRRVIRLASKKKRELSEKVLSDFIKFL
jgi:hypothetical protein